MDIYSYIRIRVLVIQNRKSNGAGERRRRKIADGL